MNNNAHLQPEAVAPDDDSPCSNSSAGVCEPIAAAPPDDEAVLTIDVLDDSSPSRPEKGLVASGTSGSSRQISKLPMPAKFPPRMHTLADALVRNQNGQPFIAVRSAGNPYAVPVRSPQMKAQLRRLAYDDEVFLPSRDVDDLIEQMGVIAEMHAPEQGVWYRVAPIPNGIELDIGDDKHTRVRITPGRVDLLECGSDTLFYRTAFSQAMVLPAPLGNWRLLKKYLNVDDVDFLLVVAWISYTLAHPKVDTTAYVHLVLNGGQGSGKTLASKVLLRIVDPSVVGVQMFPNRAKDIGIAGQHAHVLAFDNLRHFRQTLADALCVAATGGSIGSRQLYTDDSLHLQHFHVPLILNGIHQFVNTPDLAQRCLPIRTRKLEESSRKSYGAFEAAFNIDLPTIFRGILNLISGVLTHLPDVVVTHPERMIAFSEWLAAMELVDGTPNGVYQSAYSNALRQGQLDALQENVLASAVIDFASKLSTREWRGTPQTLLSELNAKVDDRTEHSNDWPSNPISLSKRLNVLAASLASQGIEVDFVRGKERMICLTLKDDVSPEA